MKKILCVIAALFLGLNLMAIAGPMDSVGVTKINNKLHVRYLVEPGETIYGISTRYHVSVADLLEINPDLENGLKVGQMISIPYDTAFARQKKVDENVITHKVQPGETLYSLAKKYNTTVNDLLKNNNMELKAGQEIVVGYKNQKSNQQVKNTNTQTNNNTQTNATPVTNVYNFDPNKQQILVIPFDPYLYFSDADDEIAAKSKMPRTKVRDVFRRRLNALLEAPGYEMIYLLGGRAKDTLSDLNKIYSSVSYNYQNAIVNPNYKPVVTTVDETKNDKTWLEKQKDKLNNTSKDTRYDVPEDHGNYFGVKIRNPSEFYAYFSAKYSIDYYIFINQFEVKTNYENCLDRAAQNYERTFTTHFSIYDANGKQIAGDKFKTHYNSNSNYVFQIVADNCPKIADRIIAELPPPGK
jgi:LysM repeat protein